MIKLSSFIIWNCNNLNLKASLLSLFLIFTSFKIDKHNSSKKYSREKIYVHFDKPYYSSGDDIWFKVYLVDAKTNQQIALSKIVYIELINLNKEIVYSRKIKIENGSGNGDFQLSHDVDSGQYLIRAYTNFMRNYDQDLFFRKTIHISSFNNTLDSQKNLTLSDNDISSKSVSIVPRPDIQFFPEGGNLIHAISNRVGFKALDITGNGIDIQGILIDTYGNKISDIKSSKFGMGRFTFKPLMDQKYQALIKFNGQEFYYDLPEALPTGIVMNIEEGYDHFQIKLQSSEDVGLKYLVLLGQQNGEIVFKVGLPKSSIIKVPKSIFKQGIIQFTLIEKGISPLAERLVFLESKEHQPNIIISFSQQEYAKRELVACEIILDDIDADASVTVTDVSVLKPDIYGLDIKSHLLLNSELKGEIECPGYYFQSNDPHRKIALDILMMTQGWRRFVDKEDAKDHHQKYRLETGFSIKGKVLNNSNSKNIVNTEMILLFKNNEELIFDKVKTNKQGQFIFGDYDINDPVKITIQAKNTIENKNSQQKLRYLPYNSFLELATSSPPDISLKQSLLRKNHGHQNYIKRVKSIQHLDSIYDFEGDFVQLNEVTLAPVRVISGFEQEINKEKTRKENKRKKTALYTEPNYTVDIHSLVPYGNSVLDMLEGRIPGSGGYVGGEVGGGVISINNTPSPLILIDGTPIPPDLVESIDVTNIDFVDILKSPRTNIYGRKAYGGVIAIYLKDGSEKQIKSYGKEDNAKISFMHTGYDKAREFYEPNYKTEKPEHKKPDYRSTLCWKPNMTFDDDGKAKISFYAADISTTYKIELQGITSDGIPITSEALINID